MSRERAYEQRLASFPARRTNWGWFKRALTAWALVNGPAGALLIAAQVFGVPSAWMFLLVALLPIALFPAHQLWDILERRLVFGLMPTWYYAFGYPCGVVVLNLVVYVACGFVLHRFDRAMRTWVSRRGSPTVERLGLGPSAGSDDRSPPPAMTAHWSTPTGNKTVIPVGSPSATAAMRAYDERYGLVPR